MIDFSNLKSLTIPEGEVKKIECNGVVLWEALAYTNLVPTSTEIDGSTIFNSGKGYREGVRLSSSGAEKSQSGSVVTGFIKAKRGDLIRMKGATWGTTVSGGYCYIQTYDKSGKVIHSANRYMAEGSNGVSNAFGFDKSASSITTDSKGVTTFNMAFSDNSSFDYIRINATGNGADMIVTINEEIT